ncbi:putative trans-sialidase, Group V [Trypanosoma cruzi]|uniref:Trans-sialidase, putative n=3 Tax=Trypanosoma cruzi TaxID=5693 RepID=Q4DGI9_TRYCC|nr:trans-sialidase, putative [Trypanosoma cruzi]EAN91649.1 trans-sialidase, putative [Trypanosoma cruzi]KAF8298141.1 putative trans-sialidase, Group V [Trypanosoma cruzi]PWV08612.1 putative trans-sialidase, Group V [Trypanosoma cruzi]|eukprot:XP_813500.1 trans-sialidase [Trypanosoma cruzi strain CL Brener]
MLLRVAAVEAPRTHNRRRVTGSSGRRREGRESEPQMPNMSRRVFTSAVLLFLVVMMCCGSGAATAEDASSASGSSPEKLFHWRDTKDGETVSSLRVPSLVEMNGDVFAVAEAQCTGTGGCVFTGIASEFLSLTDEQPNELDTSKLKTQVLVNRSSGGEKCPFQTAVLAGTQRVKKVHVSRPTTVVQGSDIYMLAGNYSWTYGGKSDSVFQCGLLLVKGNISNEAGSTNKRILWKDTYDLPWISNGRQEQSWTRLIGGGGSGIKTKGNTLLFPLEGTKKEDGKAVSLIMYSSDTAGWTVSREMSADGCGDPSVVEWKDKLIMMTACDDGRRRVYEFNLTESWTEALGTLSRVWGNKHKGNKKGVGSGFITARIEEKDVMLVTLPVYAKTESEENGKGRLHLWLTDNTHIVDIGPVSGEGDDDVAASSLLYKSAEGEDKNEGLIALYEKKDEAEASPGMVSVRLTAQLQRVKKVLTAWKEVDDRVSKLCRSENVESISSENACSPTFKITDGLVGFLSGNFSDKTWKDEYLGVNATVKGNDGGAEMTDNGVKFQGAWAEWPVGAQGENQLYHFANYKFTLVATVSIDGVPEEGTTIPLMGVKMSGDGNSVLLGLSYNNEKKWILKCSGGTTKELKSTSETERTRHVVVLLKSGGQGSAYVDGQRVGNEECALGEAASKGISHFYIGGDGGSAENKESREDVSVTVTNVLLYNRPLSDNEIGVLNPNKVTLQQLEDKSSEPLTVSSDSVNPNTSPVTAAVQQTGTLSTPDGKHLTEQGQSMGSSNAGSGGASTTAVSTITTPSAGEESVMQVASGTSSDGHKNVGGGSSSDGEPTVETREGGTSGGVEEVNTQIREVNATALSSNLGNVSQENKIDAGTMRESGLLPLLLLLLGLWGFVAL